MSPTCPMVTIRVLPRNAVVNDEDFAWLQRRLGAALPVFQVTFDTRGNVVTFAVHSDDSCASVFVNDDLEFDMELPGRKIKRTTKTIMEFKQCVKCGDVHILHLPAEGYRQFQAGVGIQFALPDVSEEDRELLLSGVCPDCWEELMK